MMRDAELRRTSICECGYSVLLDEIKVGTVYRIDPETVKRGFAYGCGGCGKIQLNIACVQAEQLGKHHAGWLPWRLFLPLSDPAKANA